MKTSVAAVLSLVLAVMTAGTAVMKVSGYTDASWAFVLMGLWVVPLAAATVGVNAVFFGLLMFLSDAEEEGKKIKKKLDGLSDHTNRSEL